MAKDNLVDKKCWVLTDARAGNDNQSIALANLMQFNYEIKNLQYNALCKLPNWFGLNVLTLKNRNELLKSPLPDIVISAGRRCSGVAQALKKRKPNLKVIQIMGSGINHDKCDIIILPKHDKKPAKRYLHKTIFINGALSFYCPKKQAKDIAYWNDKIAHLPRPIIGALIGGPSRSCSFKLFHARELTDKLLAISAAKSASLMIVVSRRTPHFVKTLMKDALQKAKVPYEFYDAEDNTSEYPNRGALVGSDILVVTGDSVSMCSEAAEMKKPLYIFVGDNQLSEKHIKFVQSFFDDGIAQPLEYTLKSFNSKRKIGSSKLAKTIAEKLIF